MLAGSRTCCILAAAVSVSPVDLTAASSLGVPGFFGDCSSCAAHDSSGLLINCDIF